VDLECDKVEFERAEIDKEAKASHSTVVFFLVALLFGACAALIWSLVGETWECLCDGDHYMALYEGRLAASPFGYRVLTPYVARVLPWGPIVNFGVVTLSSLVVTTGVIAIYSSRLGEALAVTVMACTFWVTSFPFIYYGTTLVRADGPMLLLVAVVFLLSHCRVSVFSLVLLIALGTLSHETILICVPALWIDKLLTGILTGGQKYKYSDLLMLSFGSLAFVVVFRLLNQVLPGERNYLNEPIDMIVYSLEYSGGILKHILRIYASYGPVLLFAALFAAPWRSFKTFAGFIMLLILAVGASFLATDTLRVMAIVYFPVLFYAAKYVNELCKAGSRKVAAICLALQILYSFTVYGHLRSFESSLLLNTIAIILSFAALVVCLSESLSCASILRKPA
jgi:hypothetical protein